MALPANTGPDEQPIFVYLDVRAVQSSLVLSEITTRPRGGQYGLSSVYPMPNEPMFPSSSKFVVYTLRRSDLTDEPC
jgi:hypothetical protein